MKELLTADRVIQLLNLLREARNVVVCAHRSPDGDAVGSSLAWSEYLRGLGKHVSIILPNPFPDFLRWLPNSHTVIFADKKKSLAQSLIQQADLICCLDFNDVSRLQDMGEMLMNSRAKRLIIDHHLGADASAADFVVSYPQMSSTCELVFRLIDQLGAYSSMSREAAAALYCGMMTDTGGFTYNSNNCEIFFIVGKLIEKGIDKDKIYRQVYHNYSVSRIRLQGYILYEKLNFYQNNRAAIFSLTREEMKRFHFIRGDAEGIVNMPLQVKGARLSISLREDTERDVVRVSLRSVDDFPCNIMAEEFFNGGGHLNASGGELPFPLEDAVKTAEKAIEAYAHLL